MLLIYGIFTLAVAVMFITAKLTVISFMPVIILRVIVNNPKRKNHKLTKYGIYKNTFQILHHTQYGTEDISISSC